MSDYATETGSTKAKYIVDDWEQVKQQFIKFVPLSMITVGEGVEESEEQS